MKRDSWLRGAGFPLQNYVWCHRDFQLAGPEVDRTLGRFTRMFSPVGALGLPKVVLGDYVISGKIEERAQFFAMLEQYLGVWADSKIGVCFYSCLPARQR